MQKPRPQLGPGALTAPSWSLMTEAGPGCPTDSCASLNGTVNIGYINYSCVEGWTGVWSGQGNTGDDPLLSTDCVPVSATSGDGLHLNPGSPCIDAADNNQLPDYVRDDLDDYSRFRDDPVTSDTGRARFVPASIVCLAALVCAVASEVVIPAAQRDHGQACSLMETVGRRFLRS